MDPGSRGAIGCLKCANFVVALQRQCDLIETLQKSLAPPRIDLERVVLSGRRDNRLRLEVDADFPGALCCLDIGRKGIDDGLIDDNGKDSILEAVGKEDVAKAGADDGPDSHFL